MSSTTRQMFRRMKSSLELFLPSITMCAFLAFAFFMGIMIVLSMIPLYIPNQSVEKTIFIRTSVRISNYTLSTSRSVQKRDVFTLEQGMTTMNTSVQSALEEQLQIGDRTDRFNITILTMTTNTVNLNNMSVLLDFLIVYTKECRTCDKHRQSIIHQQLCSNNQFSQSIFFLIDNQNLTYSFSQAMIVYSSYIPITSIIVITEIISSTGIINTNQTTQYSNKLFVNNYSLTVTTAKSNYFATLDEVTTQNSASQNAGPVPLTGATTMYSGLAQTIENQFTSSNVSTVTNITIDHVLLHFWYMNSTVEILTSFLMLFSMDCNAQCQILIQQQLTNLTHVQIQIQPASVSDGQVYLNTNGNSVLYQYSLTTQVISNFSGTVISTKSPIPTVVY